MVIALSHNDEQLAAGEIRGLELVAVRYTGPNSSIATRGALASQGKWPGTAPLNNGTWYFAMVPDEGLAYLESRGDLDVVYADDNERFAEALLSRNSLPDNVFGRGANRDLQTRVFDALGLEDPVQAGPIDAQLRTMADVDDEDVVAEEPDDRVSSLANGYARGELKEAVKTVREDASEFSLRGAGVTEMAEFLAGKDDDAVNAALADADGDSE